MKMKLRPGSLALVLVVANTWRGVAGNLEWAGAARGHAFSSPSALALWPRSALWPAKICALRHFVRTPLITATNFEQHPSLCLELRIFQQ